MYATPPFDWQRSHVTQLDKKTEGSIGKCSDTRLINGFDDLGKLFFKVLLQRAADGTSRVYACGYAKHKSRIDAMLGQNIMSARLRGKKKCFCTSFLDVKNAFYSPSHTALKNVIDVTTPMQDRLLLAQRVTNVCLTLQCTDGDLHLLPGSGIPQGGEGAARQYLQVYHPVIDSWWEAYSTEMGRPLMTIEPVLGTSVDLALSTYADDLAAKHVADNIDELREKVVRCNELLDVSLATVAIAQNTAKQEHVVSVGGVGAGKQLEKAYRGSFFPGKVVRDARYLGGRHHYACRFGAEFQRRKRAAVVGWMSMGSFWSKAAVAKKALLLVFYGIFYGALLSGLEAFHVTREWALKFDKLVLQYGRKVMRGAACQKYVDEDGQTVYRSIPARDIWRYLGLVPTYIELVVRRLKYWQGVARFPHLHTYILGCMLGTIDDDVIINDDGRFVHTCNVYAKQFIEDCRMLEMVDGATLLLEVVAGKWLLLLTEYRDEFAAFDLDEIRSRHKTAAIPPPGTVVHEAAEEVETFFGPELQLTCQWPDDTGSVCGAVFKSDRALTMHQTVKHQRRTDYFKAAVTNVCPWCREMFASIPCTINHIKNTMKKGICSGRHSYTTFDAQEQENFTCPFCQVVHPTLDEQLKCITLHVPGPFVAV